MSGADGLALRQEVGAARLARDVVRASGPDALSYLQGQLSQDLGSLGVGDSAFSLVLQPQGKVDAFVRVTRVGDDALVLDTDAGWGEALVARLARFKLRMACELERLDWDVVAVRGPGAAGLPPSPEGAWRVLAETPGVPGFDLLGSALTIPEGVPEVSADAYEALRVEAGVPRMGAELDERTIPAAAGIVDRTVSFTKGCYTGQELVARIDARGGNVPQRLRGVVVGTDAIPPPGAAVRAGERDAGRLTSVAFSPALGTAVALAYARRDIEPPAEVVLRWEGGQAPARVVALPLVG